MESQVILRREGAAGIVSLNRPQAIHALTLDMVQAITASLLEWRADPTVTNVMIDHAAGRGYCAGGDITLLRHSALTDGGISGRRFFASEYRLNHLIFEYPKPVISFMDGITMGGGVGLAAPAKFRIATENTRFAMPETGIGLFPDVGGGWYLPRLSWRVGEYLALTGARIDGSDCLWVGLATHYLSSADLKKAKSEMIQGRSPSAVLTQLRSKAPEPEICPVVGAISKCFASNRLEDIFVALAADGSEWARRQIEVLGTKSPLSSKVALKQLAIGSQLGSFGENMAMEYRIASRMLTRPDFAEGVRALIIDKDQAPRWTPSTPGEVDDEVLHAIFAPLPANEEWTPLPSSPARTSSGSPMPACS